jgi:3-oxoacyl-[acyl-carrier protein] reductase
LKLEFAERTGVAVVAGGSGAIGTAIAHLLARRGSRIAMTYRGNRAAASQVVSDIQSREVDAEAWQLDLTDAAATVDFLDVVHSRFGGIHTLVYAAGPDVRLLYASRIPVQQFKQQLEADTVGFFNLVQPALPSLREANGALVAVSTMATSRVIARDLLSAAPKAAIEAAVKQLAVEEGRFGVRANCVGVGALSDGMSRRLIASGDLTEETLELVREGIPLRRFGTAIDVAEAVCFLASDRAAFITGQTLTVDGGQSV